MSEYPQSSTSTTHAQTIVEGKTGSDNTVTEEVRLAVVMYGGVSLAIYMNGIAQELLHLVRATARDSSSADFRFDSKPVDAGQGYSPASMASTEPVYRKLAQVLSAPGAARTQVARDSADSSPNHVRFIVDVVTGTSAGGINGIFLSKALATGEPMDMLERLWIDEGDIGKLINDSKSRRNGVSLPATGKPQSLLNSDRMYVKLLEAFSNMSEEPRISSAEVKPLVDELDLFVTTTDIRGRVVPLRTFDRLVYERRFKHVFRFQYSHPDFGLTDIDRKNILKENLQGVYDFRAENDAFLAFAARCTSSFPFAFEPMRLEKVIELARRNIDSTLVDYWKKRFFTVTHLAEEPPDEPADSLSAKLYRWLRRTPQSGLPIETRPFGDGGYLDNKPFGYAIEMLTHRQSLLPGTRKLIYIEPSPEHPEEEVDSAEPPDAVENSLAALVKLPGYETIREDLMRVNERNRLVRKVKELTSKVVDTVVRNEQPIPATVQDVISRMTEAAELTTGGDLTRVVGTGELRSTTISSFTSYLGYHLLRVYDVTDRLAAIVGTMAGIERESSYFYAIRCMVRAWRERTYERGGEKSLAAFLSECDLWFYLRWVKFLRVQIDQLYPLDEAAQNRIRDLVRGAAPYTAYTFTPLGKASFQATLRRLGDAIADLFCQFRAVGERLAYDAPATTLLTLLDSQRGPKTAKETRAVLAEYRHLHVGFYPPVQIKGADPVIEGLNWETLFTELQQLGGVLDYILGVSAAPEHPTSGKEKSKGKRDGALRFAPRTEDADREYVKRAVGLFDTYPTIGRVIDIIGSRLSQQISAALPMSKLVPDPTDSSGEMKISLAEYVSKLIGPERSASITNLDERLAYDVVWRLLGLFPDIDAATFPMTYETELGEPEPIDVIRFSPEDSTSIVDEALSRTRKLHGTSLGHFGAFLDARWRRYDILWGRLDASERLIRALWRIRPPQDQEQRQARQKLINDAHELIIRDYLVSYTDERVMAELQGTTVNDELLTAKSAKASGV